MHPADKLNDPTLAWPNEVLAMVFEAGMPLDDDFGLIASHVTQRWRDVALACPRLWSKIQWREPYTELEIERIMTFLWRSKTSPVEIYFNPLCSEPHHILPVFQMITHDHIEHCSHLSIWEIRPDHLLKVLKNIFSVPAPMLKSIDLGPEEEIYFETRILPFGAPLLTAAHLSMVEPSTLCFSLPAFKNLTSLRLTDLYIDDQDQKGCDSFGRTLMALPALRHLEIQLAHMLTAGSGQLALESAINSIHATSLTTLSLPGPEFREPRLAGDEELTSHFPSLRHLIFTNHVGESPNVGVIARRFPNITRLTYQVSEINAYINNIGHFLDAISLVSEATETSGGLPTTLWPQLDTIAVSALHETNDALQLYEKISRLQGAGIQIRKLKLPNAFFAQSTEAVERLRQIVELERYSLDWPSMPYDRHYDSYFG
ncbi:hypothetical protein HWV62_5580 [Athelia sp. TMB]|nr:hypothetical protein HWV62_5580 [Athelia sp. TMB]